MLEACLLALCLLLAALVLLKQLGLLTGSSSLERLPAAPATKPAKNANSMVRQRFNASLRESVMAQSLGVSAGRGGSSAQALASPIGLGDTPMASLLKSRGIVGTPLFKAGVESSMFSPLRSLRATAVEGEGDVWFTALLHAITYDDTVDQSAYGFSVSTQKNTKDFPWIDTVLQHGQAEGKLKAHERLVSLNSESTKGWSAERVKLAVLASPLRLFVEVAPEGGERRTEVRNRARAKSSARQKIQKSARNACTT